MLTILDRYIGRAILSTTLLVLLVLVVLAGIFDFIRELDEVGSGGYTVASAAQYVLLTLPGRAYLLFAPAVLLGSLLGLGTLAAQSELIVMRAAGISQARIVRAVLVTGVLLMFIVIAIGETMMPVAEKTAERLRSNASTDAGAVRAGDGLWAKSGDRYVKIGTVTTDLVLLDLEVHRFDGNVLVESLRASNAVAEGERDWLLDDVRGTRLVDGVVETYREESVRWSELPSSATGERNEHLVDPEVLQGLSSSPDTLPATAIYRQIEYLENNDLDPRQLELALWLRVASPLSTVVMLMLSLPFVFASQRGGGAGQRIFVGILLGVVYVLGNRLLTQLALSLGLPPSLSAFAPLLFFLGVAVYGLRRSM